MLLAGKNVIYPPPCPSCRLFGSCRVEASTLEMFNCELIKKFLKMGPHFNHSFIEFDLQNLFRAKNWDLQIFVGCALRKNSLVTDMEINWGLCFFTKTLIFFSFLTIFSSRCNSRLGEEIEVHKQGGFLGESTIPAGDGGFIQEISTDPYPEQAKEKSSRGSIWWSTPRKWGIWGGFLFQLPGEIFFSVFHTQGSTPGAN